MAKVETIICSLLFLFMGCATIIHGTNQHISVNSSPQGAKVSVNGIPVATTPAKIKLSRSERSVNILIEKEGYKSQGVIVSRKLSGWFFGNLLIGGWIGMIIDAVDGAMFRLEPSEINVVLSEFEEGKKRSTTRTKKISEREGDIAALPLRAEGLPPSNVELLWKAILEVCAVNTSYRVLTKENVFAILKEKEIDINQCSDVQCSVEYGRMLQADKLITGEVSLIEGIYYVSLSLYDLPSAAVENAVSDECRDCDFNQLLKLVKQLTSQLLEVLK
jgi:hypothetical protein